MANYKFAGMLIIALILGIILGYGLMDGMQKTYISPNDSVNISNFWFYDEGILIHTDGNAFSDYRIVTIQNTGSMRPTLDYGHAIIIKKPYGQDELHVGDIVMFKYIHRIIQIGYDDEGWYAITKGDNNYTADVGKLRFSEVKWKVIGVFYDN